jgi:hypothetical protein
MDKRLSPRMTWDRRAIARSWVVLLPLVVGLWLLLERQRDEQQGLERAIREARLERERLVAEKEGLPNGRPEGAALSPDRKPTPSPSPKSEQQKGFIDRDVLGDPELAPPVARRQRRSAMANYRRAIDSLNLAPAEKAQLKELIAARWMAGEDVRDMLRNFGDATPELTSKALAEAQAESEASIRSLLGDERSARLLENYTLYSEQRMDWQLAAGFWDAGVPLNESQQFELTRVRHEIRRSLSEPERSARDPATGFKQSDTLLLREAARFLSPQQLEFLREEWRIQAQLAQASRLIEELQNRKPEPRR